MSWGEMHLQGASEDPNFTAMIAEFRATRAFLREVLVFTDASALHIQRVMVRTAYPRVWAPGNLKYLSVGATGRANESGACAVCCTSLG